MVSDAVGAGQDLGKAIGGVVKARGGPGELASELGRRLLERREVGVDRAALRDAVSARGLEGWMGRMEQVLVAAAEGVRVG